VCGRHVGWVGVMTMWGDARQAAASYRPNCRTRLDIMCIYACVYVYVYTYIIYRRGIRVWHGGRRVCSTHTHTHTHILASYITHSTSKTHTHRTHP
jgi:hypothetical protein